MRIDATIRGRRINHWWTGGGQWYRSRSRRRSVVQRAVGQWGSERVCMSMPGSVGLGRQPEKDSLDNDGFSGMKATTAASALTRRASLPEWVNECGPHLIESLDLRLVKQGKEQERTDIRSSRSRQHQHHQHHQHSNSWWPLFVFAFQFAQFP